MQGVVRASVLGIVLAATAAVPLTAALGQDNPIRQRQALMKEMGDQTDLGMAMVKGQVSFDAAKAEAIFATYRKNAPQFVTLFPPGSDAGDTKALPAVWRDRAAFEAADAAFVKAVNGVDVSTSAAFAAALNTAGQACRACHQDFKKR